MYRLQVAAVLWIAASFVSAQVEVEDRKIPNQSTGDAPPPPATNAAELYYQLQVLQQEVLQLRGMVEQQNFEIKKLKQQRLDDYLDLDRRVSELAKGGAAGGTQASSPASTPATSAQNNVSAGPSSLGEMQHYKKAMNLVLRELRYDDALVALKRHLEDFPNGRYTANAKYWLGEVYLKKKNYEEARQWFSRVVGEHAEHNKMHDAQYKLAVVYHLLGDESAAKSLLKKVSASNSNAARLASNYLKDNFPQ